MTTAIYKVVRNIKHKKHGWIILGRFVKCRPEFAKNYVIRRELVRCSAEKQASVKALWIDSVPEPVKTQPKKVENKSENTLPLKRKQTKKG